MTIRIHTLALRMSLAYLIESREGLVLVDAGLRGEAGKILKRMQTLGRDDLRLIFITHAHIDHYGSAAELRRITGAPIAIHHADARAMEAGETRLGSPRGIGRLIGLFLPLMESVAGPEPAEADLLLDDGSNLGVEGLDAKVLHTPGHTFGSTTLLIENRLAFSGDLVTTTGRPHIQRAFAEDWSLIPSSFDRLRSTKPEWVYPGHGRQPLSGHNLLRMSHVRV